MEVEKFGMIEVIDLLGISYPGKNNFCIDCPSCGGHKKLNIDVEKNVFRCAKCDTGGGFLHFYAFMKDGTSPEELKAREDLRSSIFREIANALSLESPEKKEVYRAEKKEIAERETAPELSVEERHIIYRKFLKGLILTEGHRNSLLKRGLSSWAIDRNLYRSVPHEKLSVQTYVQEGYDLIGIPGFYRRKSGGISVKRDYSGFFIPVRSVEGKIQGLQIRKDDSEGDIKYVWFSSYNEDEGSKASACCHFVGDYSKVICLTEGPLKADIIHHLSGFSVLAIPGVNSQGYLKKDLESLKEKGLKKVRFCFDMDYRTNEHVKKALGKAVSLVLNLGLEAELFTWDPEYKGFDDYLKFLHEYEIKKDEILSYVRRKPLKKNK